MTGPPNPAGEELALEIFGARTEPLPEGRYRVTILTSRGEVPGIFHPCQGGEGAVIWVGGASGGFDGPAGGIYASLGDELLSEGLSSLRLNYRSAGELQECALDTLAGVSFLKGIGATRIALVGHSFGGAVVVTAGALSPMVKAVVTLSTQNYGATGSARLAPRPLLLVHGEADYRLSYHCSEQVYELAQEPKELVIIPGAGHGLRECRDQLHDLLKGWLVEQLR